jgi:hypothetical protein
MSGTLVHLGSAHLPIALAVITVFLFGFALVTKSPGRLKFAVEMLIIGAALSWPAFLSGEKAEHFVEDFVQADGVALEDADPSLHKVIHEHEEIAEKAHYGYQALGVVGILSWFFVRKGEKFRMPVCVAGLVMSFALAGAMGYTGFLGGHIRHIEVRSAAVGSNANESSGPVVGTPGDDDGESDDEEDH